VANDEQRHVALPKLYGAPAYARPPAMPVQRAEPPFDPDALPLESLRTDEDRELARALATGSHENGSSAAHHDGSRGGNGFLRARPFRLRAIAGRFRGDGDSAGA